MRTVFWIFVLFLVPFLSGCQEDEIKDPSLRMLVGTWVCVGWFDDEPREIDGDGASSTDLFSQWDGCTKHSKFVISKPPKAEIAYTGSDNSPDCPPSIKSGSKSRTIPWEYSYWGGIKFTGDDFNIYHPIIRVTSDTRILQRSTYCIGYDEDYELGCNTKICRNQVSNNFDFKKNQTKCKFEGQSTC